MLTQLSINEIQMAFPGAAVATLDGITLSIQPGEFVAIVGPSGCGKSTLLRLIAGLLEPTSGTVNAAGDADASEEEVRFGFVFQHPTLLPWRTSEGNLRLPFDLEGSSRESASDVADRISRALNTVGLAAHDAQKRPAQLSGGMQMRLSLARGLIQDPDVLLLDEPFAAVDDLLRLQLQEDVRKIHELRSLTTVLVTHNLHEAVFMSDRVIVLGGSPAKISTDLTISIPGRRQAELRSQNVFHDYVEQLTRVVFGDLNRTRTAQESATGPSSAQGEAVQ